MANNNLKSVLKKIKYYAEPIRKLSDEALQNKTFEFKERLAAGEALDKMLPEAYAVVCEADYRILGKYPYDVQIFGAIAMHKGYLIEMNTGEGKTLTATMPLYLNALTGKSTILVTSNEYLAVRDSEEMGQVYNFLGMSVAAGAVEEKTVSFTNEQKKEIYNADIVYTTHGALGFDYLLNNLVSDAKDRFMRDFYFVIIDEADSVLLDAAQMPLVISGSPRVQLNLYGMANFFVNTLEPNVDFEEEEKKVWLTKKGVKYAESYFGIDHFYSKKNFEINRHVTLALRARVLFEKEKEYIISDSNEITLLDNGTGRSLPGMKLRGGQHQALEAKEGLELSKETRSVAVTTYQNLFLMFPKFTGMSGTLADAKKELKNIYKKKIVVVRPNKTLRRKDLRDKFFKNAGEQYEQAIQEVVLRHKTGQPVLIITSTIEDTELISHVLVDNAIPHSVLNANNAFWEAEMIKEAGQKNAVTVATGMAGRGTDIKLGEGVEELGGLAVIGIGRMANTRQERQAKGRAGRQGDPGVSLFFVSLEDEVVSTIGEKKIERYADRDRPISKIHLKRLINGSQTLGEENAVSQREQNLDFDKVIKRQREIVYGARNRLLDGVGLNDRTLVKLLDEVIGSFLKSKRKITDSDINRFVLDNLSYDLQLVDSNLAKKSKKEIKTRLCESARELLNARIESFINTDESNEFVRRCVLESIDQAWVEEVDYIQQLQAVVSGRSYAQRQITHEYQLEAFKAFNEMQNDIKKSIVRNVLLSVIKYDNIGNMVIEFP